MIRYEFQTDGYDIGFGVFRKISKERLKASEMDTILSTQRSNCHLVPEDGAVECDLPGICKSDLIWLHSKCHVITVWLWYGSLIFEMFASRPRDNEFYCLAVVR